MKPPKPAGRPTPAGQRFLDANPWWFDRRYVLERDVANVVYQHVVGRLGFNPNDDATFVEVAKRLKSQFPELPLPI